MKRFLILIVLLSMFTIDNVSAQVISYSQTKVTRIKEKKVKKERQPIEVRQFVGAEGGIMTDELYAKMSLGAYYEVGAVLNKSIFLGGGLSLGNTFNNDNFYTSTEDYKFFEDYTSKGLTGKLYVNAKFYLTKTKLRPCLNLSVGGMANQVVWPDANMDLDSELTYDLFANPQFGLDYYIGRKVKSISLNIGYGIYSLLEEIPETGAITLKLGISF